MSLVVYVSGVHDKRVRRYRIVESTEEKELGRMWWGLPTTGPWHDTGGDSISHASHDRVIGGLFLTADDAERITGLHCPAAWDRLREMVQDSGEWVIPPQL